MIISERPIAIGAGASFKFNQEIIDRCFRVDKYDEPFNLSTVIGPKEHQRILVPRNMVDGTGVPDLRSKGLPYPFKSAFVPRNTEQARVIDETVALLLAGNSFILEAPTGFGKTFCAMDIIAKLRRKTIVIVTKEDIRDQWRIAAEKVLGLSRQKKQIGFIQGDVFEVSGRGLVIALVQSIAKEARYNEVFFREFGLAIWDETHRVGADYFSQSGFRIPALLRLGISATPDRKDGRTEVIQAHIGPVLVCSTAAPMTPRVIARRSPWKIPMSTRLNKKTGKREICPMPHTAGKCGHVINMLCKNHARNLMIANFARHAWQSGRTVLVQSDRKEHLEVLANLIMGEGVAPKDIAYYVGGMKEKERDFAKTKRMIMATYQMTAEATDIPQLDTLVMATPKSDVQQIVGRIIRELPGKKEPLVFDIVDAESPVFMGYWKARSKWYSSVGAQVDSTPD